jgi:hypothetical protein
VIGTLVAARPRSPAGQRTIPGTRNGFPGVDMPIRTSPHRASEPPSQYCAYRIQSFVMAPPDDSMSFTSKCPACSLQPLPSPQMSIAGRPAETKRCASRYSPPGTSDWPDGAANLRENESPEAPPETPTVRD